MKAEIFSVLFPVISSITGSAAKLNHILLFEALQMAFHRPFRDGESRSDGICP